MRNIILATGNEGKVREARQILSDLGGNVMSLREAGIRLDVEEDGSTFIENAKIKATAAAAYTKEIVLADDSGLEIDYLGGEPGIYSARYAGKDTPYSVKNQMILDRMAGVPIEKRTARFVCAVAAVIPGGNVIVSQGFLEGTIALKAAGNGGFGYDPIFMLEEYGCTAAELSSDVKNHISHRAQALTKMKQKLIKELSDMKDKGEPSEQASKKKILIVSDTHRQNTNLAKVITSIGKLDLLIHLGDAEGSEDYIEATAGCPCEILAGNSDFFSSLDREKTIDIGKYTAFLTHGNGYYVSLNTDTIMEEAASRKVDIVMYGHTHKPSIEIKGGITALNPGSLSYPRQEGRRPSYIIMELDENGIAHYSIHYL